MRPSRPFATVLAMIALVPAVAFLAPARSAVACTGPGPLGDPDLLGTIVGARIIAREIDASGEAPTVVLTMAIDRVLFGDPSLAGMELKVRDSGAYVQRASDGGWVEGPAICGTIGDAGSYVVTNLAEAAHEDYQYHSGGLDRMYLGSGPGDPQFETVLAEVAAYVAARDSAPLPPDAGGGLAAASSAQAVPRPWLLVAALTLSAGAIALVSRRRASAG